MQLAGDDRLADAAVSKSFFERVSSKDKTLHVYEGLYHEIFNEKEEDRKLAIDDLECWIDSRL